jgi:hypothetical protein
MTFIPESFRVSTETFSPVSAAMLALLAAIVITGFWEFLIQEIKLKRLEQKRRRMIGTNQNIDSDRDRGRGNEIDVGGDIECAPNGKSIQSSIDHFAQAVERLQKLDTNLTRDNPNLDRVTQDLESDLRGLWSTRDLAKGSVQGSKNLPVLLHGNGSKGKLRRQERQRRYR